MRRDDVIHMSCPSTILILVNPEDTHGGYIATGRESVIEYLKEYVGQSHLSPEDREVMIYHMNDDGLGVYDVPSPVVLKNGAYSGDNFIDDMIAKNAGKALTDDQVFALIE
jgi:hypothetical protein